MSDFDIAALADNELKGEERNSAEQLVANDNRARAEYQSLISLKKTLGSKLSQHTCSETWSKCQERLRELEPLSRTETIVGRFSYAMAAVLIVAIFTAAYFNRTSGGILDRGSLQRTLSASGSGVTMMNPNDQAALSWIRQQLHQSPAQPIKPGELRLVRIDRITEGNRLVGRLVYTDGNTDYVLVMIPGATELPGEKISGEPGKTWLRVDGKNLVCWSENQTAFVLAADKPVPQLLQLIK